MACWPPDHILQKNRIPLFIDANQRVVEPMNAVLNLVGYWCEFQPASLSRRLLDHEIEVLASVPLMLEYEAVLTRPEHLDACGLSSGDVNAVPEALAKVIIPVCLRFLWRPRLKDPADEMVLETAVNGQADWLVTLMYGTSPRQLAISVFASCGRETRGRRYNDE